MSVKHEILPANIQATQLKTINFGSLFCLEPSEDADIYVSLGFSANYVSDRLVRIAVLGRPGVDVKDSSLLVFPLQIESIKARLYT